MSWDSTADVNKMDTQSFLFSVDKQTKYPIIKDFQYAICCNPYYGPVFGGGHTICVYENSNQTNSNYVRAGGSYNIP